MADPAAGARSESRMEAVETRVGLIVVVLDEDEAETLVTVTGDAFGELDTALAAGQGGRGGGAGAGLRRGAPPRAEAGAHAALMRAAGFRDARPARARRGSGAGAGVPATLTGR